MYILILNSFSFYCYFKYFIDRKGSRAMAMKTWSKNHDYNDNNIIIALCAIIIGCGF